VVTLSARPGLKIRSGAFFIRFCHVFARSRILGIEVISSTRIRFFSVYLSPQYPGSVENDHPARSQFQGLFGPWVAPVPGLLAPEMELPKSADQDIPFIGQGLFSYAQEPFHGLADVFFSNTP